MTICHRFKLPDADGKTKERLGKEGSQLVTNCNQLKLEPTVLAAMNTPCKSLLVENVLTMPTNRVAMGVDFISARQTYPHTFICKHSKEFVAPDFSKVLWQAINL